MAIEGINGSTSFPLSSTPSAPATPQAPPKPVVAEPQLDTVKLTGTALAKSLKLAGQTPAQIALKMGLDINTINSYLNIKVATATTAPPPPPAPEATTPVPTTAPAP
jgi:hypothetical protein